MGVSDYQRLFPSIFNRVIEVFRERECDNLACINGGKRKPGSVLTSFHLLLEPTQLRKLVHLHIYINIIKIFDSHT